MDNIENNITVTINENEEPIRSGHSGRSGNNSGRSGLLFSTKLFWIWNLLFELITGSAFIYFMSLFHDDGSAIFVCGALFACFHAAVSVSLFKRHYRENGIRAWKFALLCFLPLLLIGAAMFLIYALSETFGYGGFGSYQTFIMAVFGFCFACYSVVYGVILAAVLGIGHLIERKKS